MTSTRQRTSICQHYWLIEPANGPTSLGECRLCGQRRSFANSPELARLDSKTQWGRS